VTNRKSQHRGRLKAKTVEALLFRTEHCFLMHLEHAYCGPSFMIRLLKNSFVRFCSDRILVSTGLIIHVKHRSARSVMKLLPHPLATTFGMISLYEKEWLRSPLVPIPDGLSAEGAWQFLDCPLCSHGLTTKFCTISRHRRVIGVVHPRHGVGL